MQNIFFTAFGAAEEVTGSKHFIEYKNTRVLLDCGMFQGKRDIAREKNNHFGFDPKTLDALFLSHAHIDHCGLIPKLVKDGFSGKIFCSKETADLLEVMLRDSARIQAADEDFYSRHKELYTPFNTTPLYTEEDVENTLKLVESLEIEKTFFFKDLKITFYPAGHVIGSVMMLLECGEQKLLFSGDLGRSHMPLLIDRKEGLETDIVVMESTYGGRTHDPVNLSSDSLQEIIKRTMARGGKVIIPSFALERTQEILYYLEKAFMEGNLPMIPIFVDSPMAIDVTRIFQDHKEIYDEEMKEQYQNLIPFASRNIQFTLSVDESKRINELHGPCIIISASGMCEAGRIRHHLAHNIEDHRNTILIVGYMAEETLGRKLIEGNKLVSILGQNYNVRAEVVKLNSFSGHADDPDLLSWLKSLHGVKQVILVHGESKAQEALKQEIEEFLEDVMIAKHGERILIKKKEFVKNYS